MTALLALGLLGSQSPDVRVVELRDPGARRVAVQAWVAAPAGADPAAWRVLARCLSQGTLEFSREELLAAAGQAGRPLLVEATDDLLSVTVELPPDGLAVGAHVVASLLTQPLVTERTVRGAAAGLQAEPPGPWEAYLGGAYDFRTVRLREVAALAPALADPARLVVTVAGPFEPGEGAAALAGRFPKRPRALPLPPRRPAARLAPPGIRFVEVAGPVLSPADAGSPPAALAAFALGVGKGGSMHRVLREERQWSYRQEAVFWPTARGWALRLVMARAAGGEPVSREEAAAALRADVERWGEADRLRALAMAEAALAGRSPVNPFHFSAERRSDGGLASRAAWAGFLELTGQGALDAAAFLGLLRQVTLEELRAAALRILEPGAQAG